MGWVLVAVGGVIALAGALWVILERAGFRGLPGDIFVQKGGFTLFFPIVSCIVISIVLTIVLNLFRR